MGIGIQLPNAPAAVQQAPAAPVADASAEKPKRERLTQANFVDKKSFFEHKLKEAEAAVARAVAKRDQWAKKVANPGLGDVEKQTKKVEKLAMAINALKATNPAAYAAAMKLMGANT